MENNGQTRLVNDFESENIFRTYPRNGFWINRSIICLKYTISKSVVILMAEIILQNYLNCCEHILILKFGNSYIETTQNFNVHATVRVCYTPGRRTMTQWCMGCNYMA